VGDHQVDERFGLLSPELLVESRTGLGELDLVHHLKIPDRLPFRLA